MAEDQYLILDDEAESVDIKHYGRLYALVGCQSARNGRKRQCDLNRYQRFIFT